MPCATEADINQCRSIAQFSLTADSQTLPGQPEIKPQAL